MIKCKCCGGYKDGYELKNEICKYCDLFEKKLKYFLEKNADWLAQLMEMSHHDSILDSLDFEPKDND